MTEDMTQQVIDRLARVETKIDYMMTARDIAQEALTTARNNTKAIDDIRADSKWLWRTAATSLITSVFGGAVAIVWTALKG